jgi:hypothetical protein
MTEQPESGITDADKANRVTDTNHAGCQDCQRDWTGSAVEEVAAAHAARYDHEVVVQRRIRFDGAEEQEGDDGED